MDTIPATAGLIPLVAAAVIIAAAVLHIARKRKAQHPLHPLTYVWMAIYTGVLLWMSACTFTSHMEASIAVLFLFSLVLLVCGLLALLAEKSLEALDKLDEAGGSERRKCRIIRLLRDIVAILGATVFTFIALEVPWNNIWADIPLYLKGIEALIIVLSLGIFYFLAQRRGIAAAIPVAVWCVLGQANHFVYVFKGTAILPGDLLAIDTAFAVGGNYELVFANSCLYGFMCAAAALALLSFVRPPRFGHERKRHLRAALINIPCAIALAAGLAVFVTVPNYRNDFDVQVDYWWPFDNYQWQGILPQMVAEAHDFVIVTPEGYSQEEAQQLLDQYVAEYDATLGADPDRLAAQAQFQEIQPSVVVIMNESFSDLSIFNELGVGYTGPAFFNEELNDALAKGTFFVSTYGGGTCNTEFEFLSQTSFGYIGSGKYPYMIYDLSRIDSLPRQFKAMGYGTHSMHPNEATNWHRNTIYPDLGFDTFYSIEDFEGADTLRGMVTDAATYDKVLEILQENDGPQFIWDLTMMNHGDYQIGGIPQEQMTTYDFGNEEWNRASNEYLSTINQSDQDFKEFLEELAQLDEPVVVVMFGDHQPGFTKTYADLFFPDLSEMEFNQLTAQTVYTVWANYDVAGNLQQSEFDAIDDSQLAAQTLYDIGAPLTDFEMAQMVARQDIPAINLFGYMGADGTWYGHWAGSDWWNTYRDMTTLTYYNFAENIN